jgi:hypothetical protein
MFFCATLFVPILLAVFIGLWLHAISGWSYFFLIWAFVAILLVGWLFIGFSIPMQKLMPGPEQSKDIAGTLLSGTLVLPGWLQIPMPIVAIVFAIPTVIALLMTFRSRIKAKLRGKKPPHKLILIGGFVVFVALVGLAGRHAVARIKLETNRKEWKSLGGSAHYRNSELTSLSFLSGKKPPWKLLAKQKNLKYLSLRKCVVQDADLENLLELHDLRELHLNDTDITDACIPTLSRLSALRNLSIYGTRISAMEVQRLQQQLEPIRIGYSPRKE